MSVPQFTTPTFILTFSGPEGLDLTQAANVYVTFRSVGKEITKTGEDLEVGEKTIGVKLTQEETAMFSVGEMLIQANWTNSEGDRAASEVARYVISEQLLKEVVP